VKSRTVTATAPGKVELVETNLPELGPRGVRARSLLSGISHGTEMNLVSGASPFLGKRFDTGRRIFVGSESPAAGSGVAPSPEMAEAARLYPCALGYDNVARVIEVGPDAAGFEVGDLIWTRATHTDVYDFTAGEYPAYVMPETLTPEEAIFMHMGQVALYACHDGEVKLGDRVAVFGLGAIGQIVVQMAKLSGAVWVAGIDPIAERRELAARHGADLVLDPQGTDVSARVIDEIGGSGVDVAIDTSANPRALHEAIRCAAQCGLVVSVGYFSGEASGLFLGEEWHHNRITMRSSMAVWGNPSRWHPLWDIGRAKETVLGLLATKRIDVRDFPITRIPFEEAPSAYDLIARANPLKVALDYT
jgi:threonine dehydrogenase-like Zn-dependent dehydrogenase